LKFKFSYDRRSVVQSVLMSGSHLEHMTRGLFSVSQFRDSCCGAPSLTRGQVCNLLYNCFWALPEQSLSGPSPAELTAIFYCLIGDCPNVEGQVPVLYPPVAGWPSYNPWHCVSFCRLLRLARLRWGYSNPPPHGFITLQLQNNYMSPVKHKLCAVWSIISYLGDIRSALSFCE
jgi:hypothetical protein